MAERSPARSRARSPGRNDRQARPARSYRTHQCFFSRQCPYGCGLFVVFSQRTALPKQLTKRNENIDCEKWSEYDKAMRPSVYLETTVPYEPPAICTPDELLGEEGDGRGRHSSRSAEGTRSLWAEVRLRPPGDPSRPQSPGAGERSPDCLVASPTATERTASSSLPALTYSQTSRLCISSSRHARKGC